MLLSPEAWRRRKLGQRFWVGHLLHAQDPHEIQVHGDSAVSALLRYGYSKIEKSRLITESQWRLFVFSLDGKEQCAFFVPKYDRLRWAFDADSQRVVVCNPGPSLYSVKPHLAQVSKPTAVQWLARPLNASDRARVMAVAIKPGGDAIALEVGSPGREDDHGVVVISDRCKVLAWCKIGDNLPAFGMTRRDTRHLAWVPGGSDLMIRTEKTVARYHVSVPEVSQPSDDVERPTGKEARRSAATR